jgi:hypothetical protein
MAILHQTPEVKTPGKPCPGCGCPYPGDHTRDCQLAMFETIHNTLRNLMDAVSGLHGICKHQQEQINRLLKHETDQPF